MKALIIILAVAFTSFNCFDDELINGSSDFDYSIEQKMTCFCPYSGVEVKLFIANDTIADVKVISDDTHISRDLWGRYRTIKGLMNIIATLDTASFYVKVEMDNYNQYPAFLSVSPKPIIVNDTLVQIITDAGYSYTTKNYVRYR